MKQLLVLLILFISFSCNKQKAKFDGIYCSNNCYILTGKVIDTAANRALEGVELKFYYKPIGIISFDSYLGKANTNSTGNYQFQFDGTNYKNSRGYYKIVATKSGYFYLPKQNNKVLTFNLDSSLFNIPIVQNFSLYKPSKFILKVKSSSTADFEYLTFTSDYNGIGNGIIFNGGKAIDTNILIETAADIKTYINWYTSRKGINVSKKDTLICKTDNTIVYQINL